MDGEQDGHPRVQPFGDGAILVTFGDAIDVALSRRIAALVAALDAAVAAGALAGVTDLIPSYTTLVVSFDPRLTDGEALGDAVGRLWRANDPAQVATPARTIEIPVRYGGDDGPDLVAVAAHTGLSPAEVIARHAGGTYVVGALGFSPGFAFLIGLDPALATPRRATPRTAVPPGSVGIGGAQTGVYAQATPGGWSLIGRTPLPLTHPDAANPADAFLMRAGDTIRFVPIDATADAPPSEVARVPGAASEPAIPGDDALDTGSGDGTIALTTIEPGLQTTVQDLGRPGMGRYGISPGGAADRAALIVANRAVGNPDDAAALEITLAGPILRAERALRVAVAGADLGACVNDFPLTLGHAYDLRAGDRIAFDPARRRGFGVRAYLAVAGGFAVPVVMGSRATDLTAGMGGVEGRALRAGDRLAVGGADAIEVPASGVAPHHRDGEHEPIRVVRGPQADRFDEATWDTFLEADFTISSQANRMGVRLDGPSIVPTGGADLISEGMVTGAIQVTNGGQPIVMLPARATIGGYTKIATVITADLDRLGQLRPGATIRFREVSLAEAIALARGSHPDAPPCFTVADLRQVTALIREYSRSGLVSLELEMPLAGVRLRIS